MRLYIKGDYTKEIPFDYMELAKRMWFEEKDGIEPDLSYAGFLELPIEKLSIHLELDKETHGDRWKSVQIKEGIKYDFLSHKSEYIQLDYEDAMMSDFREKGECLRIASKHLDLLTVDKRAMYIMALEIATAIDGKISEDDKKTWLTVEEFKEKHQDILSLTFDEANEMSLEEISFMDDVRDPVWEEDDRRNEEYIKIHGEPVYDDEEGE
ncbi:hypothetical protein MK435_07065 [Streptococcus oralis]|uniref:Uncharacterized protein n=3 Tax=Bacteria TaxID=2 RepID=A0A1S0ZC55_SALET|nr:MULTISPECIES: hypothetical protein [Streptococcus]ANR74533.1 hypothetical protein AXF18_00600 [Streptococcus sp. oral taxon 064]MBT3115764.1 hypothetical protein [Streptococcus oralis]MBU6873200.1 hypothetical protein [Streptococcus oralis]MCC3187704.1 hypothetical protein [Streptococcus oralis]MCY7107902.1 hypothetical protein [Streptococcus oralis]